MFRKLISLNEAKKRIQKAIQIWNLGTEEVSLNNAFRRVLSEDVVSPEDVPPFSRSTMDGYAVRSNDTYNAEEDKPSKLRLVGQVNVGSMSDYRVRNGDAVGIVTGAPLPTGADAVVMLEDTEERQRELLVFKPVGKGVNIMARGSDLLKGEIVLRKGTVLSSRKLGVLAALGLPKVKVFIQPKVAIISTGAEIVKPGIPLPSGKIYDINAYTLFAAVMENGGEPISFGIVEDDNLALLEANLEKAIDEADVVITSGGVSVGPKDVVPAIINNLGEPGLVVHGVAVKPGKPVAVGVVKGKPIFALPGNPASSLLIFYLLVRPILLKMGRRREKPPTVIKATVTEKLFSARGRRTFITVIISREDNGKFLASPVPKGLSGAITTLSKADGYIELAETEQFINDGEERPVFLFNNF